MKFFSGRKNIDSNSKLVFTKCKILSIPDFTKNTVSKREQKLLNVVIVTEFNSIVCSVDQYK